MEPEATIGGWESVLWQHEHTDAAIRRVARLKARKIIFAHKAMSEDFIITVPFGCNSLPFLSHLRSIEVGYTGYTPIREVLEVMKVSRVSTIIWKFVCPLNDISPVDAMANILSIMLYDLQFRCDVIYSVREMTFWLHNPEHLDDFFDPISLDAVQNPTVKEGCRNWLSRNQKAWKKCQKAIIILLGLKQRKTTVGKDVLHILASLVWKTRGTKVWAD